MISRIFLLLSIPLLLASSCQPDAQSTTALSAIPVRSAIVVRVNNLNKLATDLGQSVPGTALQQSLIFQNLDGFVNLLGSIHTEPTNNIRAFGGLDQYGAGKFGWIWSMAETELPGINKSQLANAGSLSSREYSTSEIIQFTNDEIAFFFARKNGILLLSMYENLVEAALKQLENDIELGTNAGFLNVLKTTSSKDPANVFIQWATVPDWINSSIENKVKWPATFSSWSALDLDINANDINLTGISSASDSATIYVQLFKGTGTGSARFAEIVPENAALLVSQTCGNLQTWQKNYTAFLGKLNRVRKRDNLLKELNVNPDDWMAQTDEEFGAFYLDGSQSTTESKCGYIRLDDASAMTELLTSVSEAKVETYRETNIHQLKSRSVLPLIYGRVFSYMSAPYWFLHNDWVIFSNTLSGCKTVLNCVLAEKTWSNATGYKTAEPFLDSDANLSLVVKNPEYLNRVSENLLDPIGDAYKTSKEKLASIHWVVASIKQKSELAYSELVFIHQTKTQSSAKQHWSVDLDQPAIGEPQLVKNHYNQQNEILIQDDAYNLYLISGEGKVLWKTALDGPILGKVTQVDLYKNRKLQLAFNTAQKLYILDRNGKNVGTFPVSLRNAATAPMAVFDYENSRSYRFVVPCGTRLLNYNRDGQQVSGWNHKKAKGAINTQPKHAVIGSKDYIYLGDNSGHVYLLNRRGEVRQKIKQQLPPLASELYALSDKTLGGKITALSKSGYTLNVLFTDQLDSLQPYGEKPLYLTRAGSTFLFASEQEIYMRSDASNADIELDEELRQAPGLYEISKQQFIVACTQEDQVWVFDANGKALPGIPLYGSGKATVGRTAGKNIHLIATTKDGEVLDYILSE